MHGEREFVASGESRKLGLSTHCSIVRDNPKDALALGKFRAVSLLIDGTGSRWQIGSRGLWLWLRVGVWLGGLFGALGCLTRLVPCGRVRWIWNRCLGPNSCLNPDKKKHCCCATVCKHEIPQLNPRAAISRVSPSLRPKARPCVSDTVLWTGVAQAPPFLCSRSAFAWGPQLLFVPTTRITKAAKVGGPVCLREELGPQQATRTRLRQLRRRRGPGRQSHR